MIEDRVYMFLYWPVTTLKFFFIYFTKTTPDQIQNKNRSHTEISFTCVFLFSGLTAMQSDWANISDWNTYNNGHFLQIIPSVVLVHNILIVLAWTAAFKHHLFTFQKPQGT